MHSNTGESDHHGHKHKNLSLAKIMAAMLCLLLFLLSLMLVSIDSHVANADGNLSHLAGKSSPTPTKTHVSTPPTTSPTVKPTVKPTISPTAKPTVKPTTTPTISAAVGPTKTATATRTVTTTPSPVVTATATDSSNQTSSPISGVPTMTSGGGNGNGTPPVLPPGGPFGISLSWLIIGSLIFLGIAGAILLGLALLRKRLLPNPTPQVNLPPSGAKPWKRVRAESLNGIADVPAGGYAGSISNMQEVMFHSGGTGPIPVPGVGFPSYENNNGNIGFLSSQPQPWDAMNRASTLEQMDFSPSQPQSWGAINQASTQQLDFPLPNNNSFPHIHARVRLQALDSSNGQQQNMDRNSEEIPSLNDPFLQETLKQYMLRGKMARSQGNEEET